MAESGRTASAALAQRFVIAGAAPDTSNMGVSALLTSTVAALDAHGAMPQLDVFYNGFGVRAGTLEVGAGQRAVGLLGVRHSKRLHRPDTLATIAALGLMRRRSNPVLASVRAADAMLDLSGGDSFSDIYGWEQFTQVLLHKHLALGQRVPLVLLPQTFGPFTSSTARRLAQRVLRGASVVIARDPWSYEQLHDLLGDAFDGSRHRQGVDMAFGLPAVEPDIDDSLHAWLSAGGPVAGVNVSGMLYLDSGGHYDFGLADDYPTTMRAVVRTLLDHTDARVLLVAHDIAPAGELQSDYHAATRLADEFSVEGERIRVAPPPRSAGEAKGLIGLTDWFTGSRLHATIAALSGGVPAASIAYSVKAAGVFETAGVGDHVADARKLNAQDIAALVLDSFRRRGAARAILEAGLPAMRRQAFEQVHEALEVVEAGAPVATA